MAQVPTAQYADREGWYVAVDLYMGGARNCHSFASANEGSEQKSFSERPDMAPRRFNNIVFTLGK